MAGRFLSNTYDPSRPDAMDTLILSDWMDPNGRQRAWQDHLAWIASNVIGRPQASETYTVEQLEAMHMVGVYAKDESVHDHPLWPPPGHVCAACAAWDAHDLKNLGLTEWPS